MGIAARIMLVVAGALLIVGATLATCNWRDGVNAVFAPTARASAMTTMPMSANSLRTVRSRVACQLKLLPSAASFASSGAGCQKLASSCGFFAKRCIACTTLYNPTVSA